MGFSTYMLMNIHFFIQCELQTYLTHQRKAHRENNKGNINTSLKNVKNQKLTSVALPKPHV